MFCEDDGFEFKIIIVVIFNIQFIHFDFVNLKNFETERISFVIDLFIESHIHFLLEQLNSEVASKK